MVSFLKDNVWSLLLGINYLLAIIFSVLIVLKNRNPVKTLSYIFVLATLPFIGLLVYYFFGQDYRKDKIFEKKYIADHDRLKKWRKNFSLNVEVREDLKEEFGEGIFKIYRLMRTNENAVLAFDNQVDILINGEEKFKYLRQDLAKAKHHIHLEYFVLFDKGLGSEIIEILCKKAKEGVSVKLIYDDVGSNIANEYKKKLTDSGVLHYAFMPVLFSNSTSKLNYRDHRKIVVIDGDIGYVGGINLDQKYDNTFDNDRYWRDTHLRIIGGAVGGLQSAFILSWNFVAKDNMEIEEILLPKPKAAPPKPVAVQIAASGPDSDWANIMEAMFCAINSARESILITTPYFIPNSAILTALTTAARSGVEVRIILPHESDSWAAQYATDSYIEQCLNSGIVINRYRKGFIHAKTLVIDDMFSSVGTANMDYRSFSMNFEINALIYNRDINQQMRKQFQLDLEDCEEVTVARWKNRNLNRRLKESFSRLWAPLL
ncbi:cardiolipin synthase [Arenibacter sp. F20364]|uniref:cardiolipin synthase n=1 Tax=Arenibacter sp. F20364 TaxID=2926415 RepID=UPI001FF60A27|nr:cardiolipin synthase [Arenibacter sp. F20364]MCK0189002.1 cardiolipin synthase [Arenibacter sp. F20364]